MQLSLLFLTILSALALILCLFRVTLVIRDHHLHLLSITIAHTHSCPQLLLSTRRGVQLFFPRVYVHMDSIPPLSQHMTLMWRIWMVGSGYTSLWCYQGYVLKFCPPQLYLGLAEVGPLNQEDGCRLYTWIMTCTTKLLHHCINFL